MCQTALNVERHLGYGSVLGRMRAVTSYPSGMLSLPRRLPHVVGMVLLFAGCSDAPTNDHRETALLTASEQSPPVSVRDVERAEEFIPFSRAAALEMSPLPFDVPPYGPDHNADYVVFHLLPEPALVGELEQLFPDSLLAGWRIDANRDAELMLMLEDPRWRSFAGHVSVQIRSGDRAVFLTCMQPDPQGNRLFRAWSLYQVRDGGLGRILKCRIFVGENGDASERRGWDRSWVMHLPDERLTVRPLGIWSWNGGDSAFAAELALTFGLPRGMYVKDEWHRTPLSQWPHPVWVLFYCFMPT